MLLAGVGQGGRWRLGTAQPLPWEAGRWFHRTLETQAWVWCQLFKEAMMDGESWPSLRVTCDWAARGHCPQGRSGSDQELRPLASGQSSRLEASSPHRGTEKARRPLTRAHRTFPTQMCADRDAGHLRL